MDFQTCVEQIVKQFEILCLPVKAGHCQCERFGHFRKFIDVVVEFGRVALSRKLLKGQQNVVCLNCRRGFLTAKMWLICGAPLLLFS